MVNHVGAEMLETVVLLIIRFLHEIILYAVRTTKSYIGKGIAVLVVIFRWSQYKQIKVIIVEVAESTRRDLNSKVIRDEIRPLQIRRERES